MTKQENSLKQYWIQFKMITASFSELFDVELAGSFMKGLKAKIQVCGYGLGAI